MVRTGPAASRARSDLDGHPASSQSPGQSPNPKSCGSPRIPILRQSPNPNSHTVSASFSGSFDIGHGAFTPPARSLLTPAAAHNRLAAVPDRLDSHGRAASVVTFVNTCSSVQRGDERPAGDCGAEHENYSRLAGQRRGLSSVYGIRAQDGRFTASRLQSSIAAEKFGVEPRGQSFSGTRVVSCCFCTSLSPAPVSEPSIPPPSTPV